MEPTRRVFIAGLGAAIVAAAAPPLPADLVRIPITLVWSEGRISIAYIEWEAAMKKPAALDAAG
jgi:hypothetical protein